MKELFNSQYCGEIITIAICSCLIYAVLRVSQTRGVYNAKSLNRKETPFIPWGWESVISPITGGYRLFKEVIILMWRVPAFVWTCGVFVVGVGRGWITLDFIKREKADKKAKSDVTDVTEKVTGLKKLNQKLKSGTIRIMTMFKKAKKEASINEEPKPAKVVKEPVTEPVTEPAKVVKEPVTEPVTEADIEAAKKAERVHKIEADLNL